MKITFLILAASIFCASVYAQNLKVEQVPSVIKNSLNRSFPKAQGIEWEKQGEMYNADFDISTVDHEVWINAKGVVVKQKRSLTAMQLPATVSAQIKKQYPSHRIDEVSQYQVGKQIFYKVELENAGIDTYLVFDQFGKISAKKFD